MIPLGQVVRSTAPLGARGRPAYPAGSFFVITGARVDDGSGVDEYVTARAPTRHHGRRASYILLPVEAATGWRRRARRLQGVPEERLELVVVQATTICSACPHSRFGHDGFGCLVTRCACAPRAQERAA